MTPVETWHPRELDLPHPEERPQLTLMWMRETADLWRAGESWLVVERLGGSEIGVPYARGSIDELGEIFKALPGYYTPQGKHKLWVRGRPGWGKALKDYANVKVHSVCYEITERA